MSQETINSPFWWPVRAMRYYENPRAIWRYHMEPKTVTFSYIKPIFNLGFVFFFLGSRISCSYYSFLGYYFLLFDVYGIILSSLVSILLSFLWLNPWLSKDIPFPGVGEEPGLFQPSAEIWVRPSFLCVYAAVTAFVFTEVSSKWGVWEQDMVGQAMSLREEKWALQWHRRLDFKVTKATVQETGWTAKHGAAHL